MYIMCIYKYIIDYIKSLFDKYDKCENFSCEIKKKMFFEKTSFLVIILTMAPVLARLSEAVIFNSYRMH